MMVNICSVGAFAGAALLVASAVGTAGADSAVKGSTGRLCGTITSADGSGEVGVFVMLFRAVEGPPPSVSRYWRVPDAMMRTGANGGFCSDEPVGAVHVMGLQKASGDALGPPVEGDTLYFNADSAGNPVSYRVGAGTVTNTGAIGKGIKVDSLTARFEGPGITSISGKVVGRDGKPVQGAAVFAFTDRDKGKKLLFASDLTGADGRYTVRVAEGGAYYLQPVNISGRRVDGDGPAKLVQVKVKSDQKSRGVDLTLAAPK